MQMPIFFINSQTRSESLITVRHYDEDANNNVVECARVLDGTDLIELRRLSSQRFFGRSLCLLRSGCSSSRATTASGGF
jgi:hypothetical protein